MAPTTRWALWGVVLGALALTLWLAGPRAASVLAARYEQTAQQSQPVDLDRVGFAVLPKWLDEPLLVAVTRDLGPWLQDRVPILDEGAARRLRDGLRTVPWIDEARLERVFPDKFRVALSLRRPVLAVRDAEGQPLCLVDGEARALPWVDTSLPNTYLYREGGAGTVAWTAGAIVDEARVRSAAAIALEWRDDVAPLVPGCPRLLEVDATNLGQRWLLGPAYPEIRVKLASASGKPVTFAYGRPVDSPMTRVSVRTKAQVLSNILGKRPGLENPQFADLRLARRWADYLQPREPGTPDPLGPWTELERRTR